jgi:hypothetical protein
VKNKVRLEELEENILYENSTFVCCSSFERRSLVIPNTVRNVAFSSVFVFQNTNFNVEIEKNATEIKYLYNNAVTVDTKINDPLLTDAKIKEVISLLIKNNIKNIIIDITTFTHEMLLVLLMNIYNKKQQFENIVCLYLGAKDYSINEQTTEKWLSKGCKQIRSVVGYPGKLIPGYPLCLIVLVGYEHERAAIMIEEIEPEYLVLGKGIPSDESLTHPSHKAPMLHFQNLLENFISRRSETSFFDFSCSDLKSSYENLKCEISKRVGVNHIIIPLNTKISTLATGIVALNNKNIQICYGEPDTYNFEGYSTPDEYVTIMNDIFAYL